MIRAMAAIDSKRGLADDRGIPWNLPTDTRYYRDKTSGGIILMGYATYEGFTEPLPNRRNLVASQRQTSLRPGFELITEASDFLANATTDVWVIGGANLFSRTLDQMDELYLTQVKGDFHCTKFFPAYEDDFALVSASEPQVENGTTFSFCVYQRRPK